MPRPKKCPQSNSGGIIQAAMDVQPRLPSLMLHSFTELLTILNLHLEAYHDSSKSRIHSDDCLRTNQYSHRYRCLHLDINGTQCVSVKCRWSSDSTLSGISTIINASLDLNICSIDLQSELVKGLRDVYCADHSKREYDPEIFQRAVEMVAGIPEWREQCVTALTGTWRSELETTQQALEEAQQQTNLTHMLAKTGQKKLAQLTEGLWEQAKASALRAVVRDMLLDEGQVYMDRARELASQQPEEWRELSEQMGSLFDARDKGSQAGGDEMTSQAGGDDTISQAGGQAGDDETTSLTAES